MQAVGKPDVEVEARASVCQFAQRRLAQRDGMLPQGIVEGLVEDDAVLPQISLAVAAAVIVEAQPGAHEAAGFPAVRVLTLPEELEGTSRDPGRLFPQRL